MSMTVVIGAGTTASLDGGTGYCILSAQWGFNPGRQDAFCLGEWEPSPDHVVYKPTQTLSLTLYAPGPSNKSIPATTDCNDADTISASVAPAACDGAIDNIAGDWFIQSFSYTKESRDQAGQESWSLIKYKGDVATFLTSQGVPSERIATPTFISRGITMGEATDETQAGITFSSTFARAQTGSVSAGSMGKASEVIYGSVSEVGGGSSDSGFVGTGSASIPYTPNYI